MRCDFIAKTSDDKNNKISTRAKLTFANRLKTTGFLVHYYSLFEKCQISLFDYEGYLGHCIHISVVCFVISSCVFFNFTFAHNTFQNSSKVFAAVFKAGKISHLTTHTLDMTGLSKLFLYHKEGQ